MLILTQTGERHNPFGINYLRTHREGYLQASEVEVRLSEIGWTRARNVGRFITEGFKREIAREVGIEIDGIEQVRLVDRGGHHRLIKLESSWVRPTRS